MKMNSLLKNLPQVNKKKSYLQPLKSLLGRYTGSKNEEFLVIAHRGASGYAPENTIASFNKALELKANYIELDVQMTKDRELVVIHDTNIARTTNGSGEVREFTYEELKKYDAGQWFHKKYSGQKIPTLQDVLSNYYGKVGLLIEIKNPNLYPEIAERLATELKKHGIVGLKNDKVIVQSFDIDLLKQFKKILPNIPLGLLVKFRMQGISNVQLKAWSDFVHFINPNKALITKKLVKRIHAHDLRVIPYTVRDKKSIKGLMDARIDGIVTDYPDYFKNVINEVKEG